MALMLPMSNAYTISLAARLVRRCLGVWADGCIYNEPVETLRVPASTLCSQCRQQVLPTAHYCSNCGKKLSDPPLSTGIETQVWIYAFSIILPMICFLAVRYWPGIKYARSSDRNRKQIGFIAIALMAISTIVSYWLAFVWVNQLFRSLLNRVGNLGGF